MRILHWTESFWPRIGGAEIFVRDLAAGLKTRGHDLLVVSDRADNLPDEGRIDDVDVRRFPFQETLVARDLARLAGLTKAVARTVVAFDPDVIHLHTSQPGSFFYLRVRRAFEGRSVFTTHDQIPASAAEAPLLEEILADTTKIITTSDAMRTRVVTAFPDVATRTTRIAPCLSFPTVSSVPPLSNPPVLLALGRITHEKGFDVLIDAMPGIRAARPDVRLVIAGDGPMRGLLQERAAKNVVADCTSFPGWVDPAAVPDLLAGSTIVVVPSRWHEPFGLVALQAMHASRAVVASRVGGLAEIVEHETTGLLVREDDPRALTDAITRMLRDPGLAAEWGRNGRIRATRLFDRSACLDAHEAVYREVVA